eukprot:484970-Pyramimonas_sp.AAC.2
MDDLVHTMRAGVRSCPYDEGWSSVMSNQSDVREMGPSRRQTVAHGQPSLRKLAPDLAGVLRQDTKSLTTR